MDAWQAAGRSVCGSNHRRQGRPAQDAIAWQAAPAGVALAVADGHGSAPSFRSHIGAQCAVEAATALLAGFAAEVTPQPPAIDAEALAQELVERWRAQVCEHAAAHPFETPLDQAAGLVSYGTTLLAALATPHWILYMQIGDGDILLVDGGGKVIRPWARDERLLGVETTSLCMPEAWREVRVGERAAAEGAPALVLLSTDGYANSFRQERGFLRVGRDILRLVEAHGMADVERDLESWLQEASDLGSGDDITVGLLYRGMAAGNGSAAAAGN